VLSVEEVVRRADGGNVSILKGPWEQWVTVANNQPTLQLWRSVEEESLEGVLFVHDLVTEQTGNVASPENACARTTFSRQFKSNATTARNNQTNFIHISVLNCIVLSSKILCISHCIAAWEMKNLNKRNFLSVIDTWEEKCWDSN